MQQKNLNKRYWLFMWEASETRGGIDDLVSTHVSLSAALRCAKNQGKYDWGHIADILTGSVLMEIEYDGRWIFTDKYYEMTNTKRKP